MAVRATEISDLLKQQIQGFSDQATITNVGTVIGIGDGVATVYGLTQVMASELVEFTKTGIQGLALNLGEDTVAVIVFGDQDHYLCWSVHTISFDFEDAGSET